MKWLCERCGHAHEYNTPPCNQCGHRNFVEEVERMEPPDDEPATMTQWVCPKCGREHPKHSLPCSRCGHHELEQETVHLGESELSAPSYFELMTPLHLAAALVGFVFIGVIVLGLAGVISVPGLAGGSEPVPTVENVPGNATTADGMALSDLEASYIEALNRNRTDDGLSSLQRSDRLDEIATFSNQRRVKRNVGDGDAPATDLRSLLDNSCRSPTLVQFQTLIDPFNESTDETAGEAGRRIAKLRLAQVTTPLSEAERVGVDVHATPSGLYYVTQFTC